MRLLSVLHISTSPLATPRSGLHRTKLTDSAPRKRKPPTLLSSQRRDVDEAIKQLEPNARGRYCVVTRADDDQTVLEYAHVLAAATPTVIVRTGYHVCYRLANDVPQLEKLAWAWNLGYGELDINTPTNIHPHECHSLA